MKRVPFLVLLLSACAPVPTGPAGSPAVRRTVAADLAGPGKASGSAGESTVAQTFLRAAEAVDWKAAGEEAVAILRSYLRIDTSNAPGVPGAAGEIRDGWLYGRGSADDKGLGVLHLMAMLVLKRQQVPLARDVIFVANPDEEVGGELGAIWLTSRHWKTLDPEFVLEEGGFGYQNRYRPGLAFEVQVEQKRVFWLELTATGEGGHGSVPRENALVVLHRAVDRVLSMPRRERITPTVRATYRALAEEPEAAQLAFESIVNDPIEQARLVDSVALTRMQGSDKVNTQPREARASLDVRLLPDTNPAEFLERLRRAIADERVSIRELHPSEDLGPASPVESPAYRAIAGAVRRRYPGAIAIPTLSTGGTDSRNYRARGVAAYGFVPFVVPEGDRLSIHDTDERVRAEDVQAGVRTMFEIVLEIAGKRS